MEPPIHKTSEAITITVVGLTPGETLTLAVTPAGSAPNPQTYSADALGQVRTVAAPGVWTGIATFNVRATRANGQVLDEQHQLTA